MCQKNSCICGRGNRCPIAYPTYPGSVAGTNGWSPIFAIEIDSVNLDSQGNSRDVLKLVGWVGGTGTTPTDYIGQYVGASGYVPLIANGSNIRGASGTNGINGTNDSGAPIGSGAVIGDTYIDTDTGDVYRWNGTLWVLLAGIVGSTGSGAPVAPGLNNGDVYMDTSVNPVAVYVWNSTTAAWELQDPTVGFNDSPWETVAAAIGDLTEDGTSGISAVVVTGGSYKYKIMGKTLFLNFAINIQQTVTSQASWNVNYVVKMPNGIIPSTANSFGGAYISINVPIDMDTIGTLEIPTAMYTFLSSPYSFKTITIDGTVTNPTSNLTPGQSAQIFGYITCEIE